MLTYYKDFLSHYYTATDQRYQYLLGAGEKILKCCPGELEALIEEFHQNNYQIKKSEEQRKALAQKAGVEFYTLNYVFLACASQKTYMDYLKKGYTEDLFYDTFEDLCYKLEECKEVKGVWGNFVEFWYPIFYRMDCFKLGRLEFEVIKYPKDEPITFGDVTLQKGDLLLSVHIPSGAPLTKEARMESYRLAYHFFPGCIYGGKLVMICDSWLMFPKNKDIFPPTSNTHQFLDDWHILHSEEDAEYRDCWRLFGCDYQGNPDALPQNTGARRAMAAWLKQGKHSGTGLGLALFDGENLI